MDNERWGNLPFDMKAMEENKKFRYTKQLINMALRDGWTQKQIADVCRTQQSVVSNWKAGSAQAKESQLTKLLEVFGPKLRRRTFRVYHCLTWDDQNQSSIRIIKVEGETILSYPYRNKEFCIKCYEVIRQSALSSCGCSPRSRKILPTRRLIVHAMGKGEFCLVQQFRLVKDEHQMQFPETNIYASQVVGRYSSQELLAGFDSRYKEIGEDEMSQTENLMLQMLAKKALLEHGYPVDGIEEHLATW